MRVLFLLRFWPVYGGTETVTRRLANGFANRGHETHVAFFRHSTSGIESFVDNRVITHCFDDVDCDLKNLRKDANDEFGVGDRLCQLVDSYKIEFVLVFSPLLQKSQLEKIKIRTSAKIVWCLHGIFIPPYNKPTDIDRWMKHTLFPNHYRKKHNENAAKSVSEILPFVDKYVFLSQSYVDQCNSILKKNQEKIGYIPNPVPWNDTVTGDQLDDKEHEVLVVGRMIEQIKRFSMVLRLWKEIESSNDSSFKAWKLVFVGDGESLIEYKESAKNYKLERVEFVGYQSPIPYYQHAKIIMMTSKFEGLPMVILEAQQMGVVPIVMDSFPAIHDIVIDNNNGFIVPNNNVAKMSKQLRALMKDESLLKEIALHSLETVKEFSVDTIVDRWEQLFLDLTHNVCARQ